METGKTPADTPSAEDGLLRDVREDLRELLRFGYHYGTLMLEVPFEVEFVWDLSLLGVTAPKRKGRAVSVSVTVYPIIKRLPDGMDICKALLLHEFGHHVFHYFAPEYKEIRDLFRRTFKYKKQLWDILNILLDEHLERHLRSMRPDWDAMFQKLNLFAAQIPVDLFLKRLLLEDATISARQAALAAAVARKRIKLFQRGPEKVVHITRGSALSGENQFTRKDQFLIMLFRRIPQAEASDERVRKALSLVSTDLRRLDLWGLFGLAVEIGKLLLDEGGFSEIVKVNFADGTYIFALADEVEGAEGAAEVFASGSAADYRRTESRVGGGCFSGDATRSADRMDDPEGEQPPPPDPSPAESSGAGVGPVPGRQSRTPSPKAVGGCSPGSRKGPRVRVRKVRRRKPLKFPEDGMAVLKDPGDAESDAKRRMSKRPRRKEHLSAKDKIRQRHVMEAAQEQAEANRGRRQEEALRDSARNPLDAIGAAGWRRIPEQTGRKSDSESPVPSGTLPKPDLFDEMRERMEEVVVPEDVFRETAEAVREEFLRGRIRKMARPSGLECDVRRRGGDFINLSEELRFPPLQDVVVCKRDKAKARELEREIVHEAKVLAPYFKRFEEVMVEENMMIRGRRLDLGGIRKYVLSGTPNILINQVPETGSDLRKVFLGVLVDSSASMKTGDRARTAQLFATLIAVCLEELDSIEARFYAFDQNLYLCGEPATCAISGVTPGGKTNDAAALEFVFDEAVRSGRARKAVVVISDGQPTYCSKASVQRLLLSFERRFRIDALQVAVSKIEYPIYRKHIDLSTHGRSEAVLRFGKAILRMLNAS